MSVPAATSARMRAQRSRDTGPELAVRAALRAAGLTGYRLHRRVEGPARPDVAFVGLRIAVFVDGCWWHDCPEHRRPSLTNAGWWARKLAGNRARDARQDAALIAAGWCVIRVWEHDDPARAAAITATAVRLRRWRRDRGLPLLGTGPHRLVRRTQ